MKKKLHIGDRVRVLKGTEQGVVVGFTRNNQAEVEIEDGFRIPYHITDLVTIATEENTAFKEPEEEPIYRPRAKARTAKATAVPVADTGLFLGFLARNTNEYDLFLINNTDFDVYFTATGNYPQHSTGWQAGVLHPKRNSAFTQLRFSDIESWPVVELQMLLFRPGQMQYQAPKVWKKKFKPAQLHNKADMLPQLEREGILFQLDAKPADVQAQVLKAQNLKEELQKQLNSGISQVQPQSTTPAAHEVDLHENKLNLPPNTPRHQVLHYQLRAFESALDAAITDGLTEVTLIHGVGSGKLKNELHSRLSRHPQVASFAEAQKEKFGYGATKVELK